MFSRSKFCLFPDTILQYEDEDHDKVILSSDSDLIAAVDHARQIGWKVNVTFLKQKGKPSSLCQGYAYLLRSSFRGYGCTWITLVLAAGREAAVVLQISSTPGMMPGLPRTAPSPLGRLWLRALA
jgi:hypothetical protein